LDSVVRGLLTYFFLLVVLTLAGKRALAELDTFDFVLLLVISEATQEALINGDKSATNAMLVILTLVMAETFMSILRQKVPKVDKWLGGGPLIIVDHGKLLKSKMDKERVEKDDVLAAARKLHGLERLDQIKYAILEPGGDISIIPK
jgi:uncharacterized membrane protein YcaP (DUF421 family)